MVIAVHGDGMGIKMRNKVIDSHARLILTRDLSSLSVICGLGADKVGSAAEENTRRLFGIQ